MTSKIEAPEDNPTLKTVSSLTHHRPPKSFPPLVKVPGFVKSAYFRGQKIIEIKDVQCTQKSLSRAVKKRNRRF